jgi:hypothetical protein
LKDYINIPKTFPATAGTPARTGKPSTVGHKRCQKRKDASKIRDVKTVGTLGGLNFILFLEFQQEAHGEWLILAKK